MSNDLHNKVVVISGGAGGIGAACADLFNQQGARVVILDIQTEPVEKDGSDESSRSTYLRVDLTAPEEVKFAVQHIIDHFGRVDVLINSAGGSGRRFGDGPLHECSLEGWQQTLDLNLNSLYHLTHNILKEMVLQKKGVIVTISSILGLVGGDQDFATHAYAASKGAAISLTRSIAAYYAPMGIRANVICPGLIATPMSTRAQHDEHIRRRLATLQPLSGDFGSPQDVASAALFLASDAARFITGAVLTVDGGWTVV